MDLENNNILNISGSEGLMPKAEILEVSRKSSKLKIGIPREIFLREKRIALVPQAVGLLVANGHEVIVESGAGKAAQFQDDRFSNAGARIVYSPDEVFTADVILKVAPLSPNEIELLKSKQTLLSALQMGTLNSDYFKRLMQKRTTALSFELIRDKSRTYPVRRSMSEIVGSTTILIAAEYLSNPSFGKGCMLGGFTGITPSEVVILGAGTVGESAARAAIGLGAIVKVFDDSIYKLRRLQQSLNQRIFTSIMQPDVLLKAMKTANVVICAIHSSDGRSPVVITEDMVKQMKPGSVLIDVSIDQGGCADTSRVTTHEKPVYKVHDVTHYCVPNIASKVPHTASYALSNFFAPILLKIAEAGGIDNLLKHDRGIRSGVYMYNGTITQKFISEMFHLPFQDIELLMAAFQ